jgi:hypothetical protein
LLSGGEVDRIKTTKRRRRRKRGGSVKHIPVNYNEVQPGKLTTSVGHRSRAATKNATHDLHAHQFTCDPFIPSVRSQIPT